MNSAPTRPAAAQSPAELAWERRRRAAWLDYLRITRSASAAEYTQVEQNAWAQLDRRLRRNDELLTQSAT